MPQHTIHQQGLELLERGLHAQAVDCLRLALEAEPTNATLHSDLLVAMHDLHGDEAEVMFDEHIRWARAHAPPPSADPPANDPRPDRTLRIGYLAGDFSDPSLAPLVGPVLSGHHRERFEVHCYEGQGACSDQELEARIRGDRIDILVDLWGHRRGNRLAVLARRVAPVQVSWLGYPNTTGLDTVDYRLTDAQCDPMGHPDWFHTEQLWRLPGCFVCCAMARHNPSHPDAHRDAETADRPVTFGCFNDARRVTEEMLGAWARILEASAGSRLLLGTSAASGRIAEDLAALGIQRDRVGIVDSNAVRREADIALDTYPHGGLLGTCQALAMGTPVVTLAGQTHAARRGASLLANAGLEEGIARDIDEYVAIAARWARDGQELARLRGAIRTSANQWPLLNVHRFVDDLEAAYRRMWANWCGKIA